VTVRPDDPPLDGDQTEVVEEGDSPKDEGVTLQGDATEVVPFSAAGADDGDSRLDLSE
jgi:hypothetical protein